MVEEDKTPDPLDVVDEVRERTCAQCGKVLNKRQVRFCSRACRGVYDSVHCEANMRRGQMDDEIRVRREAAIYLLNAVGRCQGSKYSRYTKWYRLAWKPIDRFELFGGREWLRLLAMLWWYRECIGQRMNRDTRP